jgi:hypothetical protein
MRYRSLSPSGDYVFGSGSTQFLINVPSAVAQAVMTRLRLSLGEWFLDLLEGTPYHGQILGNNTQQLYDQAIQQRILDTEGVKSIDEYFSSLSENRVLTVTATITSIYGQFRISSAFQQSSQTGRRLNIDFVLDSSTLG